MEYIIPLSLVQQKKNTAISAEEIAVSVCRNEFLGKVSNDWTCSNDWTHVRSQNSKPEFDNDLRELLGGIRQPNCKCRSLALVFADETATACELNISIKFNKEKKMLYHGYF